MIARPETVRLPRVDLAPVHRARLARYLELPSIAQIDPITEEEIRKLDARRNQLLTLWQRAVAVPIERVDGRWIELGSGVSPIEATDAYACQLIDSDADALIIAAFTNGARVDDMIRHHLERDEVYEAFVLKQWAATMTEQARVAMTRGMREWAQGFGRSLLPYDGPGYNGWPLATLSPLLDLLCDAAEPTATRPLRATESGVLVPTNSMLIVFGLAPQRAAARVRDEQLAQCHRCAMRNCRYRVAATG